MGKIFDIIVSITVIALLVAIIVTTTYFRDQEYNYCVEWNGNIQRDELVWRCYNFKEQYIVCDWEINLSNNELILTDYYTGELISSYSCSRAVKATKFNFFEVGPAAPASTDKSRPIQEVLDVIDNATGVKQ